MMTLDNVLNQLIRFYYEHDAFQRHNLAPDQIRATFLMLVSKGRILWFDIDDEIVGYVESWRLSYEQFGRKLCHLPFDVGLEDIEHGPIAYVANTTILPEYRDGQVAKTLQEAFFKQNMDAEYLVGEALRKKTQPVKIFKADKVHYIRELREGVKHDGR